MTDPMCSTPGLIEQGSRAFWRATLALCLGSFLVFANVYVTQPLLPLLSEQFALSTLEANLSLSLTTLALGGSLLIYGPLSDAWGRRCIMLGSLAGAIVVTFLIALVRDYQVLLALRMLQGLLLGGLPAVAIAYMGDELSKPALLVAVGLYISGNSLGGIGGRLLGGALGEWLGWAEVFWVMGALSLVGFLLFAWLLPASRQFQPQPMSGLSALRALGGHLKRPILCVAYLLGGLNFMIFINQYSYITFVLSEAPYALPPTLLGLLFLTYLAGTLASAISGRLAQRLGAANGIGLGILLMVGGTLSTWSPHLVAIVAGLLLSSFGFFFAHSLVSSWVSRHAVGAKASASALYLSFYYLGASVGGFYLEPFWQWQGWSGVVIGSLGVLGTTLLLSRWLHRLERREAAGVALGINGAGSPA